MIKYKIYLDLVCLSGTGVYLTWRAGPLHVLHVVTHVFNVYTLVHYTTATPCGTHTC